MEKKSLEFRAGEYAETRMVLNMPLAMEELSITKIRKFIRDVMTDRPDLNQEVCEDFFGYTPEILKARREAWDDASREYQLKFMDPEHRGRTKDEKKKIREQNQKLLSNLKKAKNQYQQFMKKAEHLEALRIKFCG